LLVTWTVLIAVLLVALPVHAGLPAADSQGQKLPSLAPMLSRTMPAVVNVATRAVIRQQDNPLLRDPFFRFFFGGPQHRPQQHSRPQSLGSGVIVDADKGLVITNHHVIDKADEISVTLNDGRTLSAELIGDDPESDVAVIRIPAEHLTAMPLADSDRLQVGDFVVAIGNPFGLGQTVTSGIVSALGRSGLGIEGYEDFIQTDASINPGNSGGALVSLDGHLVGMNTAIIAPGGGNVGIGFAIPVNMVKKIMDQLVEYGEVRRGRLGISVQALTPELAQAFGIHDNARHGGVIITQVTPGSAASKAGLEVGDVVARVDGRPVDNVADLRNILGLIRVNEAVHMTVLRNGREKTVTAVIDEVKQERLKGEQFSSRLAGAVFTVAAQQEQQAAGIVVTDVKPGSPAWNANLRPGDLIVSINKRRVSNFEEMTAALKLSRSILMNIQRGNMALFILIQ
jgi:serine protease Do/serine protease DegQ